MVGPFLSHASTQNETSSWDHTFDAISYGMHNSEAYAIRSLHNDIQHPGNMTESRIYIPYSICGGFSFSCGVIFMILCFIPINRLIYRRQMNTDTTHQSLRTLLNPASCSEGRPIFGAQMFSLLLVLYILIVSKDTLINTFIYAIAVDKDMGFTPWQGVLVTTMYWVCYAVSRLVFAVIGHFVRIQVSLNLSFHNSISFKRLYFCCFWILYNIYATHMGE